MKHMTVQKWVDQTAINAEQWLMFQTDEHAEVTKLWCGICMKYQDSTTNIKLDKNLNLKQYVQNCVARNRY